MIFMKLPAKTLLTDTQRPILQNWCLSVKLWLKASKWEFHCSKAN